MIKSTQYDQEIKNTEAQLEPLNKRRSELYVLRAQELCPFKIGDIVVSGARIKRRAIITVINSEYLSLNGYGYGYVMVGRWIKKDGTQGENRQLYSFDRWERE